MRHLFLLAFTLFTFLSNGYSQKKENYSRAKIYLDDKSHTLMDLAKLGIAVDHGEQKRDTWFISDFSDKELTRANKAGFKIDIIIGDVVKHYQEQNKKKVPSTASKTTLVNCDPSNLPDPSHFYLGSYAGGYFSYTEMLSILDSMRTLYPGFISARQTIDTFHTIEGRPIYWVRVSNNPDVEQPTRPQALFTSLTHAREPGSLSSNIYTLWYLLENYSSDPQIKAILDNTELYFIPCMNPDGYIQNITTNPGGGGMVRKNRRLNVDGTYGVDLNRNYGEHWGYDNIGSSPVPSYETFRGTSAFSEPESRAHQWFANTHNFKVALSYHTFDNVLIYPWAHMPSARTVDSFQYSTYGGYITEHNHYGYGTCYETLGYLANGDSDEWMYGDTTARKKIFAMCPEIGTSGDGFYPPTDKIIPNCQNNLLANIHTALLILPLAKINSTDAKILTQQSGQLHYNIQRLGIPDTSTFTVSILPLSSWLTVSPTPRVYTGLTMLQKIDDSISYTLLATTPNGQKVSYVLQVNNGLYTSRDTVSFYYGKQYTITNPSNTSLTDWNNSGWGVCFSTYHSPYGCLQSSPTGNDNYDYNNDASITTAHHIDLTHSTHAYLNFYAKWAIEVNYDFGMVSAIDSATGYSTPLCGKYTKTGLSDMPIYDGQQMDWVFEEMDLSDYLGKKIDIRFDMQSDNRNNYKGLYLDDIVITTVEDNPTGVDNLNNSMVKTSLYPNPAHNNTTLLIEGNMPKEGTVAHIYDCMGREVMSLPICGNETTINTSTLPTNVYYLKVCYRDELISLQKMVINR